MVWYNSSMAGHEQHSSFEEAITTTPTPVEEPVRAINTDTGIKIIATDPSSGNALKKLIEDHPAIEAFSVSNPDEPTKS